ncbi:MAG: hypothetical protein ACI3U2_03085 [Anaerovibrio sp.]
MKTLTCACTEFEPNELTYQTIIDSENDVDMYGPFDTVSEMMDYINAK